VCEIWIEKKIEKNVLKNIEKWKRYSLLLSSISIAQCNPDVHIPDNLTSETSLLSSFMASTYLKVELHI
jgi:hypothetical protein